MIRLHLVFEPRDNLLAWVANRLNLSQDYESEAVVNHDFKYGGVNNTHIPNYVYRWTEQEFRKTILSHNPTGKHENRFFHDLDLFHMRAFKGKNKLKRYAIRFINPFVRILTRIFKKQDNAFAMVALKPAIPRDLWPWLEYKCEEIIFDRNYTVE